MLPTKYIWKVEFYNSSGHKHDLNNKISKGQNQPWVLESLIYEGTKLERGTQWHSWLTTCWKVAGSIPDGAIGIFH